MPDAVNSKAFTLDPGQLRRQVQILQPATAQDAFGQPTASWTVLLIAMAKIDALKGAERYQTGEFVAQVSHAVTIRFPGAAAAIAGGMRVAYGARMFQVQWVENPEERDVLLRLLCLEINGTA